MSCRFLSSCCLWSLSCLGQPVTKGTSCFHTSCPSSGRRGPRAALPGCLSSLPRGRGFFVRVVSSAPGNAQTQQFLGTDEFQPLIFPTAAPALLPCPSSPALFVLLLPFCSFLLFHVNAVALTFCPQFPCLMEQANRDLSPELTTLHLSFPSFIFCSFSSE